MSQQPKNAHRTRGADGGAGGPRGRAGAPSLETVHYRASAAVVETLDACARLLQREGRQATVRDSFHDLAAVDLLRSAFEPSSPSQVPALRLRLRRALEHLMRVSSGRARATKLISDVFFVLRTVRAVLAFVDPHLKRSIPRSLESLRTLLSTYGGSLKNVYLPDNARLEEEEEQYEMSGGEGDADEQKLQGAVEPQGAVDPLQPQPPATAEVPPPLQSNPDPQNVPQTTAQADAQPAKAAGQTQRSGDKEAEAEEQEEQPPNECAELINAYEARVREHCAALDEAIEHVRQNAAPVLEKVHAWKEAAGAFSRQMAEQQVIGVSEELIENDFESIYQLIENLFDISFSTIREIHTTLNNELKPVVNKWLNEDSEYVDRALDTTVRLTDDCLALREQLRVQEAALKALRQVEREQLRAQAALEHSKRDRARDLAHTNERRELAGRRLEQLQAQMDEREQSGRRRADEIREYRKRLKRAMKSQATKTHESEKRKLLDLIADSRSHQTETEQLQHERSAFRRQRARMSALAHSLDAEVEHADADVADAAQQLESTRADQKQLAAALRQAGRQLHALEFQVKLLKALRQHKLYPPTASQMSLSLLKSYSLPYERLAQLQAHSRRESLRFNPRSLVPPAIFYRNMFSDKNVLYRAVVLVARKIGQQWPELYLSLPFKPPRSRDTLLQDIEECRQNRGVAAANKWTYAVALRTGSGPGAASVSSGPGAAASGSGYASGSDSASVLSLSDEEGDDDGALVSSRGPGARESRAGFGGRRSRREPHIVYQMPASLKPVMERVRARLASRNTNYAGSRVGAGAVPRFPLGPLEEPAADDGLPKVMPRDGVVALSCLKRWLVFNASPSVEQLVQALEALGRRDVREALEDHIDSTFLGSSHTI